MCNKTKHVSIRMRIRHVKHGDNKRTSLKKTYLALIKELKDKNKNLADTLAQMQNKYGELVATSLNQVQRHMQYEEDFKHKMARQMESVLHAILSALMGLGFSPHYIAEIANGYKVQKENR